MTVRSDHRAQHIGWVKGKPVYRVPVFVLLNDSTLCSTVAEYRYDVIARSATAAANLLRDEWAARPETEIFAFGPEGGKVHRFVGWESAIGHAMLEPRNQLTLEV